MCINVFYIEGAASSHLRAGDGPKVSQILHNKSELKSENNAISTLKPALAQSFLYLSLLYAFAAQAVVHLSLLRL